LIILILLCIQIKNLMPGRVETRNMLVLVILNNNTYTYVPKNEFDDLLNSGKIIAFRRSTGEWVDPAVGPLRGQGAQCPYIGRDRRCRW
jgi:hypothetical protein